MLRSVLIELFVNRPLILCKTLVYVSSSFFLLLPPPPPSLPPSSSHNHLKIILIFFSYSFLFLKQLIEHLKTSVPHFDSRVFNLPSDEEVLVPSPPLPSSPPSPPLPSAPPFPSPPFSPSLFNKCTEQFGVEVPFRLCEEQCIRIRRSTYDAEGTTCP